MNKPFSDSGEFLKSWCLAHDCDHPHCPNGCSHPQATEHNSKLICLACFFRLGKKEVVEMVACVPGEALSHQRLGHFYSKIIHVYFLVVFTETMCKQASTGLRSTL
jgi:hypothetical protein